MYSKSKKKIKIPQEIKILQQVTCGYFCTGFIDFILKGESLLDYTNFFSPNDYEKNDKTILEYFQ